jgi:gas vesicle protein
MPSMRLHRSGKSAFTAGLLFGAALGAGIALLLAPESGRETRRRLARARRRLLR